MDQLDMELRDEVRKATEGNPCFVVGWHVSTFDQEDPGESTIWGLEVACLSKNRISCEDWQHVWGQGGWDLGSDIQEPSGQEIETQEWPPYKWVSRLKLPLEQHFFFLQKKSIFSISAPRLFIQLDKGAVSFSWKIWLNMQLLYDLRIW